MTLQGQRTILHADLDAFYASVEQRDNPAFRGIPLVVAHDTRRAVVMAASYEARPYGIRSAMPLWKARELCPDLTVALYSQGKYGRIGAEIRAIYARYTPLIEPIASDEASLDVSEKCSSIEEGTALARDIKSVVREETGLVVSFGIATNKMLAKIACDRGKPDGLLAVPYGAEEKFLAPLPVGILWGVGPKTEARLIEAGIKTIGDIAMLDQERLTTFFGERWGKEIQAKAQGFDTRPVVSERENKSISVETTFEYDVSAADQRSVRQTLAELAREVAGNVEAEKLIARGIGVKIKTSDFQFHTRQLQLLAPTNNARIFERAAVAAWDRWVEDLREIDGDPLVKRTRIRLLGVRATDFLVSGATRQLSLFETLH